MTLQQQRLAQLKAEITEIDPREAAQRLAAGAILLDIRDTDEWAQGTPAAAVRVGRSFLEQQIEGVVADPDTALMILCGSGVRSLFVADALKRLGYRSVASVAGGFQAWTECDLPVERPKILSATERERYARHLRIPEVGEAGQAKLLARRVALVGAGGLGSPIAYYLAAAGVGTLGLIDDDRIERSNLQRQILHTDARVGQSKARSAAETLTGFNPNVALVLHEVRLDSANAEAILADYDLVIDGSDNIATRYVVNDACVKHGIPMIYGAIFRFEGQVSAFHPAGPNGGPCYRCLFPEPPPRDLTPSCAEAGVLGVLPGVIGTLMATEALKILLGIGEPLVGRLLTYDALSERFDELRMEASPDCRWCAPHRRDRPTLSIRAVTE
ncbi:MULTISPECIES: molybdopterin-synthase adenylyltransferase MoeB [Mycetohabitans]|uniref:molybdopterin-synthase adenylyltransferase MoeB n=1 Tax=Mycetohabitans TaxID=2571159 RepID=UPI001F2E3ED3|nr:molybdopterin-synthase adenylyltransferase MoeB [Mycetohabitans sp. B2]